MENVLHELMDRIRGLQAGQIAQTRMLRAIISTHPDPAALRQAWASYSVPSVTDAALEKAANPDRVALQEALLQALADWSRRLEGDLPAS